MSEISGGEDFRKRQENALAFGEIIRQLDSEVIEERDLGAETLLDEINLHGVSGAADIYVADTEPIMELYQPADPSAVREYLAWMTISPPLDVVDVGSLDKDVVIEARLTENYIEEIREMLGYLRPGSSELSALALPELRVRMREVKLEAQRKSIIQRNLDMHGITTYIDSSDAEAWSRLRKFTEDFSTEFFRAYSRRLRERKDKGEERAAILDVTDNMNDMLEARTKVIELALNNTDVGVVERNRLFEKLTDKARQQIWEYIEEYRALPEHEKSSLQSDLNG